MVVEKNCKLSCRVEYAATLTGLFLLAAILLLLAFLTGNFIWVWLILVWLAVEIGRATIKLRACLNKCDQKQQVA